MITWRLGDSWVTTHGLTMGVGVGKMLSKQEAHQRKFCTGCGETRTNDCGSTDCNLVAVPRKRRRRQRRTEVIYA